MFYLSFIIIYIIYYYNYIVVFDSFFLNAETKNTVIHKLLLTYILYSNFRCNNVLYIRSVDDENEGADTEMKD